MKTIYLDNAASMPMPKKVISEINKANKEYYANPSSLHSKGIESRKALDKARKELANEIGVRSDEIILTSGGTESNSLAILGIAAREGKNKVIISSIEHSSVYENAKLLEKRGFTVKEIPVNEENGLDFAALERELTQDTAIVSIMSVNSETGILNDIPRIAKLCKQLGVILHVDHVQGFGKIPMQPKTIGIDLLSAGGHKIGGPKGTGLLYVRSDLGIESLWRGGEQERGRRAGTENVAGAIGFAAALKEYKKIDWKRVSKNRDKLEEELEKIGARVTAQRIHRSATHLHVCFPNMSGEELVSYLSSKGIHCSTGSACDSEKKEKRILENLGVPKELHRGAVRISLAKPLKDAEIKKVAKEIKSYLNRFKKTRN